MIVSQYMPEIGTTLLGTETFTFTGEEYETFVQKLIANAMNTESLKDLEISHSSLLDVTVTETKALDAKMAMAFRHFTRNTAWCVSSQKNENDKSSFECE